MSRWDPAAPRRVGLSATIPEALFKRLGVVIAATGGAVTTSRLVELALAHFLDAIGDDPAKLFRKR